MSRYAVIGMSNFGVHMTKSLFEEGHEVIAIDSDKNKIQSINEYSTQAIVMDATDKDTLKNLGLESLDAVIVTAGMPISTSILICLHLHEMGVAKIIVKAIDDDHAAILEKIGATDIVRPEREMAKRLAKSLSHPNILDFIPISDDFEIVQVTPPVEFLGKSLRELDLRTKYGVQLLAVREVQLNRQTLIPPRDYIINEEDTLIILGERKHIRKLQGLKKK